MARRGATTRDPKVKYLPGKGGAEQVAGGMDQSGMAGQVAGGGTDIKAGGTKTQEQILRAANRAANRAPVERLSPGVYRSAGGGLVTQGGRPIQRQPQQGMAGQVAGGMQQNPWQGAIDNMAGQVSGNYMQQNPYNDMMYRYPPGTNTQQMADLIASGGQYTNEMFRNPQVQPFPEMPQASANQGGKYRLSPGVYGTREQAMQQYNQQLQQMGVEAANQAMPNQGGGGPGNFIGQQRARELGYVENRFNAAKDNNLFRGNPIRRFGF